MALGTRAIVFNADEDYAAKLRADLLSVEGVKIVAEVDEIGLIPSAVNQFACDVVMVHLDPQPELVLEVAGQVAQERRELSVFGISDSQDGQVILAAMRAGFKEFLFKPLDIGQLTEALGRVALQRTTSTKAGKLVAVIGSIGGAGATTLATNLAAELADLASVQVALVDMDFRFGQIATFLDVQPNFTVAELVDSPEECDQAMIERAMVKHQTGVHILARPNHLGQAEQLSAAHCGSVLGALQELYDYVVVDGPSRYDVGSKTVLDMADVNLLVTQLLVTSIRSTDRLLTELSRAGYNLERIKLVCNRVGRDTGRLTLEQIETTLDKRMFHLIVDDWRSVSGAINMGEPLLLHAGKSKVRQGFRELAEKLHGPAGAPQDGNGATKSGGLLSKVFGE